MRNSCTHPETVLLFQIPKFYFQGSDFILGYTWPKCKFKHECPLSLFFVQFNFLNEQTDVIFGVHAYQIYKLSQHYWLLLDMQSRLCASGLLPWRNCNGGSTMSCRHILWLRRSVSAQMHKNDFQLFLCIWMGFVLGLFPLIRPVYWRGWPIQWLKLKYKKQTHKKKIQNT